MTTMVIELPAPTWQDVPRWKQVRAVLRALGGEAQMTEIVDAMARAGLIDRYQPGARDSVRVAMEQHPEAFEHVGVGRWRLWA